MLKGKTVVIGVSGSIAAYKMANLISMLTKQHCDVHVVMTEHATKIIHPITFETLTGHKCLIDTFDRNFNYNIEHVALGDKADLMLIAPATANVIGKIASGIADDMLTTTVLACRCPIMLSPAMNTAMYENIVVQDNLDKLRSYGMRVIEPATGRLACNAVGKGKLPKEEYLFSCIMNELALEKDLKGKKIMVTAGATQEALDPVRYITNHSSGKMGYALAKIASWRGAEVTLVSAPTNLEVPYGVTCVDVVSAADMFEAVKERAESQDIIIKAAAVADYTPAQYEENKIKKKEGDNFIELKRTQDILAYLGENRRENQYLCGFSMETQNLIENSTKKLEKKNVDLIVANNLNVEGAGFGMDTNVVTLIMKDGMVELPCMSKEQVSVAVLDLIAEQFIEY